MVMKNSEHKSNTNTGRFKADRMTKVLVLIFILEEDK